MDSYCRRLIEVDLPIRRISVQARRDQLIGHGHISTFHMWWARRPLASCRAVICAALWPDPNDPKCPAEFGALAKAAMEKWVHSKPRKVSSDSEKRFIKIQRDSVVLDDPKFLRDSLLDFIADFSDWDCSVDEAYVSVARALTEAAHRALGGEPGSRPLVMDPFAGGGSIPLEAMRVGADTFAGDLNPIAVFINRLLLEYVPAQGVELADRVREWGERVGNRVEQQLSPYYPAHGDSVPVAYLWARCVRCEGPACGVEIPLIRNMQISRKAGGWVFAIEEGPDRSIRIDVRTGKTTAAPTVANGSATCPRKRCGYTTLAKAVREQLVVQHGGARQARLLAVCDDTGAGRVFRSPSEEDLAAIAFAGQDLDRSELPTEEINPIRPYKNTRGLSAVTRIGIGRFSDLYTDRQALSLVLFLRAVGSLAEEIADRSERDAIVGCLQCAASRLIFQNCSLSRWHATRDTIEGAFGKQALQNTWDFAESNPTSEGSATWSGAVEWVAKVVERNARIAGNATVVRGPAQQQLVPDDAAHALITDPPYFASIPYGDLSDVFYVWERRLFRDLHPDLYVEGLVEKADEAIVTDANEARGGQAKTADFYRAEMTRALGAARVSVMPSGIGVIVFADTRTDSWESILGAIIDAGWVITASWPIDTEHQNRTQAAGAASLQSSIHIVCRPRENADGSLRQDNVGDWRDVLATLPVRVHEWLPRLSEEGIVGADAIFACLGPALEVFSKFSAVEKASGDKVELREYLEEVWGAVAREALGMIFEGADTSGFEEDARLTAMWLWTLHAIANGDDSQADAGEKAKSLRGYGLEFDAARKIAQGLGIHLENLSHLVEVKGETATLLSAGARTTHLFGSVEVGAPQRKRAKKAQMALDFGQELKELESQSAAWASDLSGRPGATVLDQLHQTMILFGAGRGEAVRRFLVEDGVGRDPRFWALAQALSALYPADTDEKRWVDGVLARKKGLGF